MSDRVGITIPLPGASLLEHRELMIRAADLGFTDVWSSETSGHDAFTPLTVAATCESRLRVGTAIVSAFTRGPAVLAQTAAAMCELAPGRFALGIGSSSDTIVEKWNAGRFEKPYRRVRDVLTFLRMALAGERVDQEFDTFHIRGFRLDHPPIAPPSILLAALRPRMLELAGREADGAIVNLLAPNDVGTVLALVGTGKEVVCRVFVIPSEDPALVRSIAGPMVAAYLNVPVYRAFHEWLGRGPLLAPMWNAWAAGDRKRAVALVPDQVIADLFVSGTPTDIRRRIDEYLDAGVTTPVPQVLGALCNAEEALTLLAPR